MLESVVIQASTRRELIVRNGSRRRSPQQDVISSPRILEPWNNRGLTAGGIPFIPYTSTPKSPSQAVVVSPASPPFGGP